MKCFCSFCAKSQDDVAVLVAGPGVVFICNECIRLCSDLIIEKATGAIIARMETTKAEATPAKGGVSA